MYVTICGRFYLNEGCVNRMKAKFYAKRGMQIAGMIFQTRPYQLCQGFNRRCHDFPALPGDRLVDHVCSPLLFGLLHPLIFQFLNAEPQITFVIFIQNDLEGPSMLPDYKHENMKQAVCQF